MIMMALVVTKYVQAWFVLMLQDKTKTTHVNLAGVPGGGMPDWVPCLACLVYLKRLGWLVWLACLRSVLGKRA